MRGAPAARPDDLVVRIELMAPTLERHLSAFGGRKVNQGGDGVFAVFDGPTKAALCALDLVPALANRGIRIRAGVHIGECERRGDDWSGVSVCTSAPGWRPWPVRAKCS